MAVAVPCGYTFGRIGNFMNGELYGRLTTMPWGMTFPTAPKYSTSISWVKDFATSVGMKFTEGEMVTLPRHPSQLYEAFFEGIVLFLILWFLRKKKPFNGFITSLYLIGYGLFRFVIEYFRMPDEDMGFKLGNKAADINNNVSLLNISTGQILCFIMIIGGIALMIFSSIYSKKHHKEVNTINKKNIKKINKDK